MATTNCKRCGAVRTGSHLFCSCGAVWDKTELNSIRLNGPTGESQRVDRFWRTGDPTYLDPKVPVPVVDKMNSDMPRHIGDGTRLDA